MTLRSTGLRMCKAFFKPLYCFEMNRKRPLQTLEFLNFSLISDDTFTLQDLYSQRTKVINSYLHWCSLGWLDLRLGSLSACGPFVQSVCSDRCPSYECTKQEEDVVHMVVELARRNLRCQLGNRKGNWMKLRDVAKGAVQVRVILGFGIDRMDLVPKLFQNTWH